MGAASGGGGSVGGFLGAAVAESVDGFVGVGDSSGVAGNGVDVDKVHQQHESNLDATQHNHLVPWPGWSPGSDQAGGEGVR